LKRRVVITGMGVVTPIGIGLEPFWQGLIEGKSGIDYITSFDASQYRCNVAAEVRDFNPEDFIDKKEVKKMDRFTQFAIAAGRMAVEDARLEKDLSPEIAHRVGVCLGSGIGGILTWEAQHTNLINKGPGKVSAHFIPALIPNIAGAYISINVIKAMGPNFAIVTACATGAHCIGEAFKIIQRADADVMIAGGADAAITPLSVAGFANMKALTKSDNPASASRPFDKLRDGFVIGEGAGVVVLELLENALKRGAKIYAELIGFGMSADAYHVTAPDPLGKGAQIAIRNAILDAGIEPQEVDYINAHGTSTPYNDKIETLAIKQVFGEHAYKLAISSNKSMIGHGLGSAGAVETIATTLTLNRDIIPPTINYEYPDPDCDLDYVPNKARVQKVNIALNNSFGFGGANAVLVLRKYE